MDKLQLMLTHRMFTYAHVCRVRTLCLRHRQQLQAWPLLSRKFEDASSLGHRFSGGHRCGYPTVCKLAHLISSWHLDSCLSQEHHKFCTT